MLKQTDAVPILGASFLTEQRARVLTAPTIDSRFLAMLRSSQELPWLSHELRVNGIDRGDKSIKAFGEELRMALQTRPRITILYLSPNTTEEDIKILSRVFLAKECFVECLALYKINKTVMRALMAILVQTSCKIKYIMLDDIAAEAVVELQPQSSIEKTYFLNLNSLDDNAALALTELLTSNDCLFNSLTIYPSLTTSVLQRLNTVLASPDLKIKTLCFKFADRALIEGITPGLNQISITPFSLIVAELQPNAAIALDRLLTDKASKIRTLILAGSNEETTRVIAKLIVNRQCKLEQLYVSGLNPQQTLELADALAQPHCVIERFSFKGLDNNVPILSEKGIITKYFGTGKAYVNALQNAETESHLNLNFPVVDDIFLVCHVNAITNFICQEPKSAIANDELLDERAKRMKKFIVKLKDNEARQDVTIAQKCLCRFHLAQLYAHCHHTFHRMIQCNSINTALFNTNETEKKRIGLAFRYFINAINQRVPPAAEINREQLSSVSEKLHMLIAAVIALSGFVYLTPYAKSTQDYWNDFDSDFKTALTNKLLLLLPYAYHTNTCNELSCVDLRTHLESCSKTIYTLVGIDFRKELAAMSLAKPMVQP